MYFHQILPSQKMPIMAATYKTRLPQRAKAFCLPFRAAAQQGVYCFASFNFEFKLCQDTFSLRTTTRAGEQKILTINTTAASTENHFILLSDIDPDQSDHNLKAYRARINPAEVPAGIDINDYGFYEVLLNVIVEEPPFGVYIQLWLGGVISSPLQQQILIKQAVNVVQDPGYSCLDGIIDISQWQGWLAIVLKPTRQAQWVAITTDQPICQIVGYDQPIKQLTTIPMADIDNDMFLQPLRWHLFAGDHGIKPGKYQRQIKQHCPVDTGEQDTK